MDQILQSHYLQSSFSEECASCLENQDNEFCHHVLILTTLAITRPQGAWADRNKPSEAALVHGGVR